MHLDRKEALPFDWLSSGKHLPPVVHRHVVKPWLNRETPQSLEMSPTNTLPYIEVHLFQPSTAG